MTYHNPAHLAKIVTTLDAVSHGRATLGIGAAWYELEHEAYGFRLGSVGERFDRLEEALQIIRPMLREGTATFQGETHRAVDALNVPAPISRVPILIGGNGERRTLRLVAKFADESNLLRMRSADDVQHKRDVLAGHCHDVGRDPAEIRVTALLPVTIAMMEQADDDLARHAAFKGWPQERLEHARNFGIHGDPDTVGERLSVFAESGLDGLAISASVNGYVHERLDLLGETATRALDAAGL